MGNAPLWKALAGARHAVRQAARPADRRGRHAPGRTRRHRRRRRRLHRGSRRRHPARRAGRRRRRCTNARWASCRADRKCACCWRRRCSATRPRCCWTSPPTTSIWIRSTGCRIICCDYEGVLIVISHDRHFLNSVCTHVADIDYETVITYTGGYDDMVLAKTQIRSRIEAGECAARKEDRAAERVHRALLGRHAVEPGDVAQEGSGAAADLGAGEVEYPAPVHPLRHEAAVGPASAGDQGSAKSYGELTGDRQLHRQRLARREDRADGPQRGREDHAAEIAASQRHRVRRRRRPAFRDRRRAS